MSRWSLEFDAHDRWLVLTDPEGASRVVARDVDLEWGGDIAARFGVLDESGSDLVFSTSPAPEGIDTDCMFIASPGRVSVHISRRAINAQVARRGR